MIIQHIKLYQFKNYEHLALAFDPAFNIIVGKNGMGKTNLLDAIYYLSFCKSNYQHQDGNVVSFNKDSLRVHGEYLGNNGRQITISGVVKARKAKKISKNKKEYLKLSDHIGLIPLVMITPDDIQSLKEGSEERRKLLDTCISQYSKTYLAALLKYKRILKQRNAYLKSVFNKNRIDHTLLDTLDSQLIDPAQTIYKERGQFLDQFNPIFEEIYQYLAKGHEVMKCKIKSHLNDGEFKNLLLAAREKDIVLQRTTVGVHKDDLKIYMDDRLMKTFASQGQIKSGILSIKLAQYKLLSTIHEEVPILLLDDIFDKLDRSRVEHLLEYILDNDFGQTFITDTHQSRVTEILKKKEQSFSKFVVIDGNVTLA